MRDRWCRHCNKPLSRYNSDAWCAACADKAAHETACERELTALRRLVLFEMLEPGYHDSVRLHQNRVFAARLARVRRVPHNRKLREYGSWRFGLT